MENVVKKSKWKWGIISIGFVVCLTVAIYQQKYGWDAFDVVASASESFTEQQTFAYTKTTLQKVKTKHSEILDGGIHETFSVQIAKDQSFKVDYTDAILEKDNKTITDIDKATLYFKPDNTNYTSNLGYSFKANELRLNQYELQQVVLLIAEEFENTKNHNNQQFQELRELYEDGEYIITYKTRINDMSTEVSEYIIHIDSESKAFKKIIVKDYFEGFGMTKTYVIDNDYIAADSIKIPEDVEEILN